MTFEEGKPCKTCHLFSSASSHSLEAKLVRLMNLRNFKVVFLKLLDQLRGIQLAVAAAGLDDLRLLLEREVLPGKVGSDVFLEQGQNLVVGDCAWVSEVVDAGLFVLGEEDGGWEKIVEDGVGVGDVDYALVFGDLGDEVAGVKVIGDRHAESENEAVGVVLHDLSKLLVIVESVFECR